MDDQNSHSPNRSSTQSTPSRAVADALYRLSCEWPINPDKMFGKRQQLEALCAEIGEDRFERTIASVIDNWQGDYCPPMAQIRLHIPPRRDPQRGWVPTREDYEDRRRNPDKYFGEADVICMMRAQSQRIAEKKPLYTHDQLEQIVLKARKKYGHNFEQAFRPKPQPQPKRNPEDYVLTEADCQ